MELLSSMDTPTFMLAFRRLTALRGPVRLIRSDRGSNFLGASSDKEEKIDEGILSDAIKSKGCDWEFLPARASWMAGAWEAKVGQIKRVLSASMSLLGTRSVTREEFLTVLQESASVVNRTPLSEVSCDPSEPFPVSPAMLLNMREFRNDQSELEEFSEDDLLAYGKKRWRRVQNISDQFYVRWKREYLQEIQKRNKWKYPKRNLCVGDVVLIKDVTPRHQWPMGLITKVILSEDKLVRRVILKIHSDSAKTQYRERAIHDLVLLVPVS